MPINHANQGEVPQHREPLRQSGIGPSPPSHVWIAKLTIFLVMNNLSNQWSIYTLTIHNHCYDL
jgi:hypothetical protein